MSETSRVFQFELRADTVIVTPLVDLRELDYKRIDREARYLIDLIRAEAIANVVIDFGHTDYYGSTAITLFVKLWKIVREREGTMVFCRVSRHEQQILQVSKLDGLWPICATRDEALRMIQNRRQDCDKRQKSEDLQHPRAGR